jgi:hypothetical protein
MKPVLSALGIDLPLVVSQEQVTYYATPNIKQFTKEKFVICYIYVFNVDYYIITSFQKHSE